MAQRASPQHAAARHRELLADGLAGGRARVALGDQGRARLEHERLHLRRRTGEDLRRSPPGSNSAELEQDQRLALIVGQLLARSCEELPQVGAAPDVLGETVDGRLEVVGHRRGLTPRRQQREAAVAGDGEQPRPHRRRVPGARSSARWARRNVCCSTSSPSWRLPHMWRQKASKRRVMPVVQRLEGTDVALAHERSEPRVVEPAVAAGRSVRPCPPERRPRRIYSRPARAGGRADPDRGPARQRARVQVLHERVACRGLEPGGAVR